MVTNEERREVAKKMICDKDEMLRVAGRLESRADDAYTEHDDVHMTPKEVHALADDLRWLVNLIDSSTCHNVSGHEDVFMCSECGARLELIAEEGNEYGDLFHVPFLPSYCPSCGAEVVD